MAGKENVPEDVKAALAEARVRMRLGPHDRAKLATELKYLRLFAGLEVGTAKGSGAPLAVALVDFSQLPASCFEADSYQPKALAALFSLLEETFARCKIKVTSYLVRDGYFQWSLARAEVAKLERLVALHRDFIAGGPRFLGEVPEVWKAWADDSAAAYDAVTGGAKPVSAMKKAATAKKTAPTKRAAPAVKNEARPAPARAGGTSKIVGPLPSDLTTSFLVGTGWWLRRDGDRLPYRASTKGVLFAKPGEVIGMDLRKVAASAEQRIARPPVFVVDGATTNGVLKELTNRCDACGSRALSMVEDEGRHVVCRGCGGMFDHDAFAKLAGDRLTVEWAARLEGKWRPGDEAVLTELAPAMLSADGAQANAAARRVASTLSLRAFSAGEAADDALAALGDQTRLRDLHLWYSGLGERGLAHLARYPSLVHVDLGNNATVTDAGAAVLGELRGLKSIELAQTQIGDATLAVIAKLPALERLVLDSTRVTDAGLVALRDHPSLREVAVGYTKTVTNAGLKHLATAPRIASVASYSGNNAATSKPLGRAELAAL